VKNNLLIVAFLGKKFKGPDFVQKHIFNKHGEKVEEVKKEVRFFNIKCKFDVVFRIRKDLSCQNTQQVNQVISSPPPDTGVYFGWAKLLLCVARKFMFFLLTPNIFCSLFSLLF